jgi:hypothetical protein
MSVEDIKSAISSGGGLAMANRYRVQITGLSEDQNNLCEAYNMPGKQVLTLDRILGTDVKKVAYGHAYPDVNLTFIMTNDYSIKKFFDEWQDSMVTRDPPFNAVYWETYVRNVTLHQLDQKDNKVYTCELYDAAPTTVSDISLSYGQQNAYATFNVALSYRYWKEK